MAIFSRKVRDDNGAPGAVDTCGLSDRSPMGREFDDAGRPELLAHPLVHQGPLRTHDALYDGRTEAMRLHYKDGRMRL